MKMWARVRFRDSKEAESLIKKFFEDAGPKSSISINGKIAVIEIVGEETPQYRFPPLGLVKAISYCDVLNLQYGRDLSEYETQIEEEGGKANLEPELELQVEQGPEDGSQEEPEPELELQVEQEPEDGSQEEPEPEPEIQTEQRQESSQVESESDAITKVGQPFEDEERSESEERPVQKHRVANKKNSAEEDKSRIPELDAIANDAESFEDFSARIVTRLNLGKNAEFFTNLINVCCKIDQISWKNIEQGFSEAGFAISSWNKIASGQKVAETFRDSENQITILKFLKIVVKYKSFNFISKKSEDCFKPLEEIPQDESLSCVASEVTIARPTKLNCMPDVPELQELFEEMDYSQPIEYRVNYVLIEMGIKQRPDNTRELIREIVCAAMKCDEMDMTKICVKAGVTFPMSFVLLTCSEFVNDFIKKYDPTRQVKFVTFLADLKEVLLFGE